MVKLKYYTGTSNTPRHVVYNADSEKQPSRYMKLYSEDTEYLSKVYEKCVDEKQKYDVASGYFWSKAVSNLVTNRQITKPQKHLYDYNEIQISKCMEILKSGNIKAIIQNINTFPDPQFIRDFLLKRLDKKAQLNVHLDNMNDKYLQTAVNDLLQYKNNPFQTRVSTNQKEFVHYKTTDGFQLQPGRDFISFDEMLCQKPQTFVTM